MKLASSLISTILFAALLTTIGTAHCLGADERDPTTPSAEIAKRLETGSKSVIPKASETELLRLPSLRLKAIVLRDADNGTALIASGKSSVYFVPLQRRKQNAISSRVVMEGINLEVKDFSRFTVVLYHPDTDQLITAN